MKKYFFIIPFLFLNFYLAPFAYASGLVTPDSANSGSFGGLTWTNYPTSTTRGALYMWSDSSGSSTGWTAIIDNFDSSCLNTHSLHDVLAVGDCNTISYQDFGYPIPNNNRYYGFVLKQSGFGGPAYEMPGDVPGGGNLTIDYNTAILDYYNNYTADQKIGKFCFTYGTAGSCPVDDPIAPEFSYVVPSLTRLGPDPAYTDIYPIPAWDRMQFLATASSTGNFRIKLNLFVSSTQVHLQKDFSQGAVQTSSVVGWARLVNIPMTFSFGPRSSTWTYNAELFQLVPSAFGVLEWGITPLNTGTIMYDPNAYVPNTSSTYGVAPSSTFGDDIGYVVYGHDVRTDYTTQEVDTIFDKDCSGYSDTGLFSSSTLGAITCNIEKAGRGILKIIFKPGMLLDTPSYISAQFNSLKEVFPFSIFFSTMEDIRDTLANPDTTTVSSTLAVQVSLPNGQSSTTTNIVIASPGFVRNIVGEHLWAQFTNVFILALGIASISGIVAWVFFL